MQDQEEAAVLAKVERAVHQLLRYLRFDGAVVYWNAPEFGVLWPLVRCGDIAGRVPPALPRESFTGEAFGSTGPIVAALDAKFNGSDAWLHSAAAQTVVAMPLHSGHVAEGVVVAFSRQRVVLSADALRTIALFTAPMTTALRRAPLVAIADLHRCQIEILTSLVGSAVGHEVPDERTMLQVLTREAHLLTGADTITIRHASSGFVFRCAAADTQLRGRAVRIAPARVIRQRNRTGTVIQGSPESHDVTLRLAWRQSFVPTVQQRDIAKFVFHALNAADSVRVRLDVAERERITQYVADVSTALSISLEPNIVFEQVHRLFVPEVADALAIDIRTEERDGHAFVGPAHLQNDIDRSLFRTLEQRGAFDGADKTTIAFEKPIEDRIASAFLVPMTFAGVSIGTIAFGRGARRGPIVAWERELYSEITTHAAAAIANARSFGKERDIAQLLQRALQATPLPRDPRLVFDAAYVPGSGSQVGGDWYDVFPLGANRYAISMGDVGGHGTAAAITMNVVRLAFRAAALGDADPLRVLERGEAMLALEETSPMVTAIFGVIDLARNVFTYAAAGQNAPYFLTGGRVQMLATSGHPLGTGIFGKREMFEIPIKSGDTIIFYTDGLVEYSRDLIAGEQRLSALLESLVEQAPRATLARTLHRLVFADGYAQQDDTAILAVSLPGPSRSPEWRTSFTSTVPATRAKLRTF